MKAILIDSENKTITEVQLDNKTILSSLQKHVGGYIEPSYHFPNRDVVYVNEEGLFLDNPPFFVIDGYHQPLAGNGIVVGSKGPDSSDVKTSIEDVRKMVRFLGRAK